MFLLDKSEEEKFDKFLESLFTSDELALLKEAKKKYEGGDL